MSREKIRKISLVLLAIGVLAVLIPSIIMMVDWRHETTGVHFILGLVLGFGFGICAGTLTFMVWSQRKFKNGKLVPEKKEK